MCVTDVSSYVQLKQPDWLRTSTRTRSKLIPICRCYYRSRILVDIVSLYHYCCALLWHRTSSQPQVLWEALVTEVSRSTRLIMMYRASCVRTAGRSMTRLLTLSFPRTGGATTSYGTHTRAQQYNPPCPLTFFSKKKHRSSSSNCDDKGKKKAASIYSMYLPIHREKRSRW